MMVEMAMLVTLEAAGARRYVSHLAAFGHRSLKTVELYSTLPGDLAELFVDDYATARRRLR